MRYCWPHIHVRFAHNCLDNFVPTAPRRRTLHQGLVHRSYRSDRSYLGSSVRRVLSKAVPWAQDFCMMHGRQKTTPVSKLPIEFFSFKYPLFKVRHPVLLGSCPPPSTANTQDQATDRTLHQPLASAPFAQNQVLNVTRSILDCPPQLPRPSRASLIFEHVQSVPSTTTNTGSPLP